MSKSLLSQSRIKKIKIKKIKNSLITLIMFFLYLFIENNCQIKLTIIVITTTEEHLLSCFGKQCKEPKFFEFLLQMVRSKFIPSPPLAIHHSSDSCFCKPHPYTPENANQQSKVRPINLLINKTISTKLSQHL